METIFSLLFKYRPFYFTRGQFDFQWGLQWWQWGLVALTLAAAVFYLYRRQSQMPPRVNRWMLPFLRLSLLLIVSLLLMRPTLVLSTLVPKENLLALLVDNSQSLGIEDDLAARGEPLNQLLSESSDFIRDLDSKFYLRPYLFSSEATNSQLPLRLDWSGIQSNIVAGLERVLSDSSHLPLAAVVLVSDGADNSHRGFTEVIAQLKARQIPVYTIGLGPDSITPDVEITHVATARTQLPRSITAARVTLRQNGFSGARGQLEVREDGTLVESQEVYFAPGSDNTTVDVLLKPEVPGVKTYEFRFLPLSGEKLAENNSLQATLQVKDERPRILYLEGHPRWEYKFIRQSMSKDKNLQLESLLRTALNKFYRQGIEEETTLAAGFPSTVEELFQYRGLVLGSIESSFFTFHQMEMIREFVGKRGGGLLLLGGNSSFASGKFRNTPIEQVMPVWLSDESGAQALSYQQGEASITPTAQGSRHPTLQLFGSTGDSGQQWDQLPVLTDWNLVRELKPGTTLLATLDASAGSGSRDGIPLLALQRYGRGHSAAFLTGSSWRWQMLREAEDQIHERFWAQLLRWLVSLAEDPVTVETEREVYARGDIARIRVTVSDETYNRVNDAAVEVTITSPSGNATPISLQWDPSEDGLYVGEWSPGEDGRYGLTARIVRQKGEEEVEERAENSFLTSTAGLEYFGAYQRRDFLQRVADETGGRYYTLADAGKLPEEIVFTEREASQVEVLDLWDMPINLLVLLGLLCGEWLTRKRYGVI